MRKQFLALGGCVVALAVGAAGRALAEVHFDALMETVHTAHGTPGGATAQFVLSDDQTKLYYDIQLQDLDLVATAANRLDPNDVTGVHIHFFVGENAVGPHILNVFGDFGEEDLDAVFDFQNETISGIYDISDATIDPSTGEPYFQFFPGTTKVIDEWIDELLQNQLYLAVHTKGQNGAALLHGILTLVPEPTGATLASMAVGLALVRRRAAVVTSRSTEKSGRKSANRASRRTAK